MCIRDSSYEDAAEIKEIERVTNHDVKAVEYYIKQKFDALNLTEYKEFVHFGLTSQDINNTAIPLSVKDFINEVYIPKLNNVLDSINVKCEELKDITIISRTHGQPASPTRLGKEIDVFIVRIKEQVKLLKNIPILIHTIKQFISFDKIIVVLPASQFNYWQKLCKETPFLDKHILVEGGSSRFESVKNGLSRITQQSIVAIHDGVRPLISKNLIDKLNDLKFLTKDNLATS